MKVASLTIDGFKAFITAKANLVLKIVSTKAGYSTEPPKPWMSPSGCRHGAPTNPPQLPQRENMQQDRARNGEGRNHDCGEGAELCIRSVGDDDLQRSRRAQNANPNGDREIDET
jgi:hypothetical protein